MTLRPFWFSAARNFGDILTPFLLSNLGIPYATGTRSNCNALFIGSIARLAKSGTHVFGSGFMRHSDEVAKDAKWHMVRGELSQQKINKAGGHCEAIYGDPALILPDMVFSQPKKFPIAFVPHYIEQDGVWPPVRGENIVISLDSGKIEETAKLISASRRVITSSLHGLIVAHAYGVPAALVRMSDRLHGDGFKFQDYASSVEIDIPMTNFDNPVFTLPEPLVVAKLKKNIYGAFDCARAIAG